MDKQAYKRIIGRAVYAFSKYDKSQREFNERGPEILRWIKEEYGMTQSDISSYLQVSKSHVSKIINGEHNLSVDHAQKLIYLAKEEETETNG